MKGTKWIPPLLYICLAGIAVCLLLIGKLDTDSYYMIAQGRDAIANGVPHINEFTFFENYNITVQQLPYCVAMAFLYDNMGVAGLIAFGVAQYLLMVFVTRLYMKKYTHDGFISYLAACIVATVCSAYGATLRPETITLVLLILQCWTIEKFLDTKKPIWLYFTPLAVLIEINVHASMWPIHFCILAAYGAAHAVNDARRSKDTEDEPYKIKINPHAAASTLISLPLMLLNPYGFKAITYVFDSMPVFKYVQISEQIRTSILSAPGIFMLILFAIALLTFRKKILRTVTLCMIAGFSILAAISPHGSMFLQIAYTLTAADLIKALSARSNGEKASATIPQSLWLIVPVPFILTGLILGISISTGSYDTYVADREIDNIAAYIDENPGNIVTAFKPAAYLEYKGIRTIMADSRPELMLKSINGKSDQAKMLSIFQCGALYAPSEDPVLKELGTETGQIVQNWLDEYEIEYYIDYAYSPNYPYLMAFLEASPDYEEIEISGNEFSKHPKPVYAVYKRADEKG